MLSYNEDRDSGIVELTVDGHVSKAEFAEVAGKLEAIIAEKGKVRLLEVVKSFSGIDPTAIWDDIKFSFSHLNDFSRVAIVTDKTWIEWWAKAARPFVKGDVEIFALDDVDRARGWLVRPDAA